MICVPPKPKARPVLAQLGEILVMLTGPGWET